MYSKQVSDENISKFYKEKQREILLQKLIIMQVNDLQQRMLKASAKIQTPSQALSQVYELLSEEQKMAFLLAGGAEQLFRYQHQERQREQERRDETDQSSSNSRTDDLPVLC